MLTRNVDNIYAHFLHVTLAMFYIFIYTYPEHIMCVVIGPFDCIFAQSFCAKRYYSLFIFVTLLLLTCFSFAQPSCRDNISSLLAGSKCLVSLLASCLSPEVRDTAGDKKYLFLG